MERWVDLCKVN